MVLNILTTAAMVRIGKTYGNLMVDVQATSEKLKDRSRRIVGIVTGLDYDAAGDLLKRARWNVKTAIVMRKTGLSWAKANARLREHDNSMREAIGEDIEPRLRQLLKLDAVPATPAAAPAKVEKPDKPDKPEKVLKA
jgi:N-acetylmuramic acid 6-phosphate etherase